MTYIEAFEGGEAGVWNRAACAIRDRLDSMPHHLYERMISNGQELTLEEKEVLSTFRKGISELTKPLSRKLWQMLGLDAAVALGNRREWTEGSDSQLKNDMQKNPVLLAAYNCEVDTRTYIFVRATHEFLFG